MTNANTLLKTSIASLFLALLAVGIAAVLPVNEAQAETTTTNTQNNTSNNSDMNFDNLFQWVILDEVINDGDGDSNLEELFLLESLSGNSMMVGDNLSQWVILDEVLNNGDSDRDWAELFLLSNTFQSDGESDEMSNLYNLIILDRVLGDENGNN